MPNLKDILRKLEHIEGQEYAGYLRPDEVLFLRQRSDIRPLTPNYMTDDYLAACVQNGDNRPTWFYCLLTKDLIRNAGPLLGGRTRGR